jgi:hypothetical protein
MRCRPYRDRKGLEVDLLIDQGDRVSAVEIKSGRTLAGDFLEPLAKFGARFEAATQGRAGALSRHLVYGGEEEGQRGEVEVVPWVRAEELGMRVPVVSDARAAP